MLISIFKPTTCYFWWKTLAIAPSPNVTSWVCVCCVTYQKQLVHASPKYTYPAYHYRKPQSHLGSISKQDNPLRLRLRLRHTHTQTKLTKLTLILHICKQTHYISTYFAPRKSNFNFKSTKTSASKMPNIINHNLKTKFKTITIIIINK